MKQETQSQLESHLKEIEYRLMKLNTQKADILNKLEQLKAKQ